MTYDLSTSSKWSTLSDGDHTVTIVAKADGYRDSEPSTSVTVTKGSTGHTVTVTSATAGTSSDDTDAYIAINRPATTTDYDYHFTTGQYNATIVDKNGSQITVPFTITAVTSIHALLNSSTSYTWFNIGGTGMPTLALGNQGTAGASDITTDITDMEWYGCYAD